MNRLTNTAEGGTNGTTISAANSGGASGDAFDAVTNAGAGSAAPRFDNTHVYGTLAIETMQAVAAGNSCVRWSTAVGSMAADWYARLYLYIDALPDGLWYFTHIGGSGGSNDWGIDTAGKLFGTDESGNKYGFTQSTAAINVGGWTRIEAHYTCASADGTGDGACEFKIFLTPDSTTPDETDSYTSQKTIKATSFQVFDIGAYDHSASNSKSCWLDNLVFGDTAYPGPATTAAPLYFVPLQIPNPHVGPMAQRHLMMQHRRPWFDASGAIAQTFNQALTGDVVVVTASMIKQVNKFLTATTVAVTGSIVKNVGKLLTATTVAVTASIKKQVNKLLTATTVPVTASITKQVNKILTATTVAVTASLVAIKVILKAMTATTVVVTATMVRQVQKALVASSVAVSGSITKLVGKTLTATTVAVTGLMDAIKSGTVSFFNAMFDSNQPHPRVRSSPQDADDQSDPHGNLRSKPHQGGFDT